jgi:outer membrane protein assembly factor BamB
MKIHIIPICLILALLATFSCSEQTIEPSGWTHFRGNNLDGIAPDDEPPVKWSDSANIAWKTPLHGKGWSSPVILDNQIWLTTATEDGKKMSAVCIDFKTGDFIHDITLFEPDSVKSKHALNSYATPTPCIEKGAVYIHFGRYGTACLETSTGQKIWERTDFTCEHIQGPGSSPILYKNLIILHYEGSDMQFIVALDKKTGKTVWKTERPQELYEPLSYIGKKAYITPNIVTVNGKDLLISNGSAVCIAYDPETGEEVWRIIQGEDSTISMPVTDNGKVCFYTGFVTSPDDDKYAELLAVDPAGSGDITETNIIWRKKSPILQLLTPVIIDGLIYTIDTKSMMECIDADSGNTIWSEKVKGKFNASPVYADGYIYFPSTRGNTLVIKEGKKYKQVSDNKLEGQIWATPAIANDALIIRTSEFLYKISK